MSRLTQPLHPAMSADQIERLTAILREMRSIDDRHRALQFEVALLLDEARGEIIEEPEWEQAA